MVAIPCNTDECCECITAIGSLRALLQEVCDFVDFNKWEEHYIHYELTSGMDDHRGIISRHFSGCVDEGGEEDIWWIGLSKLEYQVERYVPCESEMKKQVAEVVELIRNSPNYANFMRLTQSA